MKNHPNYYSILSNSSIPSPYEHQINMDIQRTFPEDPYFQNIDALKKLKKILLAYSKRNLSIGYCQGFNFVAARLLKIMENEVYLLNI